ncbi:MAG: hypothetical protein HOO67_05625 [Candidatus Peribacteraceae bacterium]|nr:hypothetical protein [Candidatus Peribacteraceae bacterium]
MLVLPIKTPVLKTGDDLAALLCAGAEILPGDIVVVSSKAVATVEGAAIDLSLITPSDAARELSEKTGRSPQFSEAVLQECRRLHGTIVGTCIGGGLTDVRPSLDTRRDGATRDDKNVWSILVASAGLDESNAGTGFAIGWPKDPVLSARKLREELEKRTKGHKGRKSDKRDKGNPLPLSPLRHLSPLPPSLAVIITDSCCRPRRLGVTAFALTVSGLDPLQPNTGPDLFGRPLRMTTEAAADQLATAANFLMGNGAQSVPAVIIRDHGLTLSDWEGWVPGIEPEKDLFRDILR